MFGDNFPNLTPENHRLTSPATPRYNCVAWSAEDVTRWWQPGVYWPVECAADDFGVHALQVAFESLGYSPCADCELNAAHEKLALYGTTMFYTHIARQLPTGTWTSKLGGSVDIEHDSPHDVAGGVYGEVLMYMQRARVEQ